MTSDLARWPKPMTRFWPPLANPRICACASSADSSFLCPAPASTAYAREESVPQRVLTGLFQLRPGQAEESVIVSGNTEDDSISVIVEVADPKLDLPVSAFLEAQAASYGSFIKGARTSGVGESYRVELARPSPIDAQLLAEVIRAGLKRKYPRLGAIQLRVAFGQEAMAREAVTAEEYRGCFKR